MKIRPLLAALALLLAPQPALAQPLWYDCQAEAEDFLNDVLALQGEISAVGVLSVGSWKRSCDAAPPPEKANCNAWLTRVATALKTAELASTSAYVDVDTVNEWIVQLVESAESIQLGLGIQVVPAAFITNYISTAIRVHFEEVHAASQMALIQSSIAQAYSAAGNSPTLSPLARPRIQPLIGHASLVSRKLDTYIAKTEETLSGILAAALRNVAMNAGRPPQGARAESLNNWPLVASDTIYGPTNMQLADPPVTADFVTTFGSTDYQITKVVNGAGETYRRVDLVYSVPAGAYTNEIRSPIDNSVAVPANTPICATWHGSPWPTYQPAANCVFVSAYFGVGYIDGDFCTIPGQPNDLRPGQSSTCPIEVQTTGTPTTLGTQRSQTFDIIHAQTPGHGAYGFWRSSLTVNYKLERPKNPCYVWNESTKKWICSGGGR